jgi:hypothetical protein
MDFLGLKYLVLKMKFSSVMDLFGIFVTFDVYIIGANDTCELITVIVSFNESFLCFHILKVDYNVNIQS